MPRASVKKTGAKSPAKTSKKVIEKKPAAKKAAAPKAKAAPAKAAAKAAPAKAAKKPKVAPKKSAAVRKQQQSLDLCLILDCTGSMYSWIQRSKDTLSQIIDSVRNSNAGLDVKVSFVAYRDV